MRRAAWLLLRRTVIGRRLEWAVVSALVHYERVGLDPTAAIVAGRVSDVFGGLTDGLPWEDPELEVVR